MNALRGRGALGGEEGSKGLFEVCKRVYQMRSGRSLRGRVGLFGEGQVSKGVLEGFKRGVRAF